MTTQAKSRSTSGESNPPEADRDVVEPFERYCATHPGPPHRPGCTTLFETSNCRTRTTETLEGPPLNHEATVAEALTRLLDEQPVTTDPATFAAARFDAGLAWVWFAEGHGGLGVPPALQAHVLRALSDAGAPEPPASGLGSGMAAPTIYAYGSPEQQATWLGQIFSSGEWWCQLFSEPGAGSDIASLATRAVRDGDEWIVSGQKVWTSGAQHSDWGLLVARSDPEVPKHRGMSFFIVDMHSPGVDVRPLRNLTGLSEFNEVFLTDVRVPDRNRIGAVGDGWRVLLATLMNERLVFTAGEGPTDASALIVDAVRVWQQKGRNPTFRDRLMHAWVRTEVQRIYNIRAVQARSGDVPGHEGSLGKVAMTELNQLVSELTLDLLGPEGCVLESPYPDGRYQVRGEGASRDPRIRFLRARANTIEGGTSEAQRNNIGDHVLRLPPEPRTDKVLPWSQVPRN